MHIEELIDPGPPAEEQVAVRLGLTGAQLDMVRKAKRAGALRTESGFAAGERAWDPEESADVREAPDAALDAAEERQALLRRLDRLDDRERMVVSLRYGLDGGAPLTLREVGGRLGVTREWARAIGPDRGVTGDEVSSPGFPEARGAGGRPAMLPGAGATAIGRTIGPSPRRVKAGRLSLAQLRPATGTAPTQPSPG